MVSPGGYFKEVVRELKKVTWPTRQQTLNKTLLVIAVSAALAFYLGGLDLLFQKLTATLIK
jgi:preprotein translocase subunit SecE